MEKLHKSKTFEQRLEESTKIRIKYPNRVCVYLERLESSLTVPDIDKHKYLVPNDITMAQFIIIVRKRLNISPKKALFFYINNTIIPGNTRMIDVNDKYKESDGFIYIKYTSENCFG